VEFVRPQPQLKTVKYIATLKYLVPLALAAGVLIAITLLAHASIPLWVWLLCLVPWVVFWGLSLVRIPVFVRHHGYALREDDFVVTTGAWWRVVVSVPYGRIQYSSVRQGPLLRNYGLASVQLHTASGDTSALVQGLPVEQAEALKERLVERGNARLAGL
jgi:membrane protein YdbS with pleckstrin-like domain